MLKIVSTLLLLIGVSFISISQQNTDHLSMQLTFDENVLLVDATYTANIIENGKSVFFMFNPGQQAKVTSGEKIDSVYISGMPGRPFPFWKIDLAKEALKGQQVNFTFQYAIDLNEQNHLKSNWIELNIDKMWFPKYSDMDRKFTYDVVINNFPKDSDLVGSASITKKGGKITIIEKEPSLEVLILAGVNMKKWKSDEDEITFFTSQSVPDSILQSMNEKVKNTISLLNEAFGKAKPLKEFMVVLRNTSRKEIGFQFNRDDMIITGIDFNDYGNLSHEIAHYWWSGQIL